MSNKFNKDNQGQIIACMLEGVGLIMGKLSGIDGEMFLQKPRAVQTQQDPAGKVQLRLGEMIGSPSELKMNKPPIFIYRVQDPSIRDLFTQATTGLILPKDVTNPVMDLEVVK